MQNSCLSGQRSVRSSTAQKFRVPVSSVRLFTRPAARKGCLPGNHTPSLSTSLSNGSPCRLRKLGQQSFTCQSHILSKADHVVAAPQFSTLGSLRCLRLPLQILAALVCCPLILNICLQVSQQSCMLAMAGVLLPLHSHQSLQRFQHILQAAAAVEAETEGASPEPQGEEPNDNTIVETGAELGNVQTPASVWLPYSTGGNGKVHLQLLAAQHDVDCCDA